MAWIKVREQGHLATSENSGGEKTATRIFIAVSDVPTTTVAAEVAEEIDEGPKIPVANDPHPDDPDRKRKKVSAKPDPESARQAFIVTVEYSNKGADEEDPNPLSRAAKFAWSFEDGTEAYFVDRGEEPVTVTTSASERFAEYLTRDYGNLICTITKNIAPGAYNAAEAIAMHHVVNSGSITVDGVSVAAGQAKNSGWTCGELQEENGVPYRVSQVVLKFRESWRDKVEDRGFHELDPDVAGKVKEIIKGRPPTKPDTPWPLDGEGHAMASVDAAAAELEFIPYYEDGFGTLPIA